MTYNCTASVSRNRATANRCGIASRSHQYDTLGRPTSRTLARQGATRNDVFTYNDRSELISDVVHGTGLNGWDYDRAAAASSSGVASRPVLFTKDDNSVSVACTYDYMGRRATKVVTENGVVTTSHRFLYRGYLQVACCDRTRANHPCIWLITWDPTQPIATCPLAIQKDSTWYTYGWDLTKNIWEAYTSSGYIGTAYTNTAYGQVTASGSITQPIQWSSEYNDTELALVYYNYRHYNPIDGRWIGRDRIRYWDYVYARNSPCHFSDYNGLYEKDSDNINCIGYCNDKTHNLQPKESSLKETMEGEGWTCIPSKRGDDCSSEDTHTHDIMALFIYVKEVGHKMRRQQKQTKLSDPNDIESKPIELIQDFYEIEKLKPNNANFWSVAKDILDEYGITNMYDAKNIWDWDFESIPRYAAIKEQLKLNQIMDFDYHGVLKESPNNWSYVSCMQPKDHYKVEEAPNLRFFENEEMIEKYCCYRKKGNCK